MHYAYDFNYSVHLDTMPTNFSSQNNQQHLFSQALSQLREIDLTRNRQMKEFYYLLVRQPFFNKIGSILIELCQIQLQMISKTLEFVDKAQLLRQYLCESTKQLGVVLGRDKDYFLNAIIILLAVLITKILSSKYQISIQTSVVYHLVNWQIKGQHSTNSSYECLIKEMFVTVKLNKFLQWSKEKHVSDVKNSMTFKQLQQSISTKRNQQSINSFQSALNKQNQNINNLMRPHMLNFKKQTLNRGHRAFANIFESTKNAINI